MVALVVIVFSIKFFDFSNNIAEFSHAFLRLVFVHCFWCSISKVKTVFFIFFWSSSTFSTSEEIFEFLLGEVNVIVSVRVRIHNWIVPVILPNRVTTHVGCFSMLPSFQLQVLNRAITVIIRDYHCTFISVIVNHLCSQVPLLFFAKTFKNMIRTYLHNWNLVWEESFRRVLSSALLIFADFFVAAPRNKVGSESHELGRLHDWWAHRASLVAERLVLAVRVPVVVGLVVSVVLFEWVIQVAVQPEELGHHTQVEWHLSVLIRLIVVTSADGVDALV